LNTSQRNQDASQNSTGASVKTGADNRIGGIMLALAPGVVDADADGGGRARTRIAHASLWRSEVDAV